MRNKDHFQLTLIIIVLLLTTSTLLFGWVYLASLNNKFTSMIASPALNTDQRYAVLEEKNKILEKALGELQTKVTFLEHELQISSAQPPEPISEQPPLDLNHPKKIELTVDQKCFQDPTDLNQCAVLASASISDGITIIVRPQEAVTTELNTVVFEFMKGNQKITEFIATTALLFEPQPLAEIVYLNERDITIKLSVGASRTPAIFTYDGQGWIDYARYSSN